MTESVLKSSVRQGHRRVNGESRDVIGSRVVGRFGDLLIKSVVWCSELMPITGDGRTIQVKPVIETSRVELGCACLHCVVLEICC